MNRFRFPGALSSTARAAPEFGYSVSVSLRNQITEFVMSCRTVEHTSQNGVFSTNNHVYFNTYTTALIERYKAGVMDIQYEG